MNVKMILAIQTLNVSTQLVAFNVYVIQDIMEMEYFVWILMNVYILTLPTSVIRMVGVKTTREVLYANATLDTLEMGFTVQILMNVTKVVILAMCLLSVVIRLEVILVLANKVMQGMASYAMILMNAKKELMNVTKMQSVSIL